MITGKPEAAAAIWRWRHDDRARRARSARIGATWRAAIGISVAVALFFFGRVIASSVVGSIASLTLLLGWISPLGAYAAVQRVLDRAAAIVGRVVTWIVLAPFFYLVLAPFGLLARRGKNDKLARRRDSNASSYWTERREQTPIDRPY